MPRTTKRHNHRPIVVDHGPDWPEEVIDECMYCGIVLVPIATDEDVRKELARHRTRAVKPGTVLCLSRAEANRLAQWYACNGFMGLDDKPLSKISTGDRIYGVKIRVSSSDEEPVDRWVD